MMKILKTTTFVSGVFVSSILLSLFFVILWKLCIHPHYPNIFSQELNENESKNDQTLSITPSNSGRKEYFCIGSCFCDTSERRASIPLITRSISSVFVSVSSVFAYQRARTYFENECLKELSTECQLSEVKSSVDDCSEKVIAKSNEKSFVGQANGEEKRVYFCYGNCVKKIRKKNEQTREQFDHIECGKLRKQSEITVTEDDLIVKTEVTHSSTKYYTTARKLFQERELRDYCKEMSKMEYEYDWESSSSKTVKGKPIIKKQKLTGYGCVGRSTYGKVAKDRVRNVRCRQVDPKPEDRSSAYWDDRFWQEKKNWDDGKIVL